MKEICAACGHEGVWLDMSGLGLCYICDYFIPAHIPRKQCKKFLAQYILQHHNYRIEYSKDGKIIERSMGTLTGLRFKDI